MAPLSTALVVGATGLVGRECLRLLLGEERVERVITLTRRELPAELRAAPGADRLGARLVSFDELDRHASAFAVTEIYCALGTTIRQAGSSEQFRRVDFDYALAVARLGRDQGAAHFLLVSALGANARSRIFYNRVKGELERAVLALGYPSTTIVRPSLLLGERAERRRGEELAKRVGFLFPRKYRPVSATAVAATLVRAAREGRPGARVIESAEIS